MPATQPDYGIDISCTDDLDPLFRTVRQLDVVKQAMVRRLQSPIGSLFLDPRYGLDVRGLVSTSTAEGANAAGYVAGLIRTQMLMDERIDSVSIESAQYDAAERAIAIRLAAYTSSGPFGLVLKLNATNLEIITQG